MAIRIADMVEQDRPRERLARKGVGGLSDAELLALVVRSGAAGRSAVDVGAELLAAFGSLPALAVARPEELARATSIGAAKAAGLVAAFELGRRAATAADARRPIRGPTDIIAAVRTEIGDHRREEAFVIVVNAAHRVIKVERLTTGSADRCLLPPRDVLAVALRHDGLGFAVAHTHPSGDPRPSAEDVGATRSLAEAAKAVGLRFLDHVVIARDAHSSLKELGHF
jgi:DNA repair protein RadC